jgi:hypothetical protein
MLKYFYLEYFILRDKSEADDDNKDKGTKQ